MQPVSFAEIQEHCRESVDLAAQRIAHRKLLARANQRAIVGRLTGELTIKVGQRLRAGRIDEQSSDQVQKVVTGGALDRPRCAQLFAAKEDLLGHNPAIGARRPQALKVFQRIAQSVGMIDSQSRQAAVRDPLPD